MLRMYLEYCSSFNHSKVNLCLLCFPSGCVFKEEMSVEALEWTTITTTIDEKNCKSLWVKFKDEVVSLCMMKPNAHIIVYETSEIQRNN